MKRYAPDVAERATRDVVSRSAFLEMMAGRECEEGAVRIEPPIWALNLSNKIFPVCAAVANSLVMTLPGNPCRCLLQLISSWGVPASTRMVKASLNRLFVAGEDGGGVHGGNRLGRQWYLRINCLRTTGW